MFFRIVGILWMALGIWWILRPQGIKRRFSRTLKKARRKIIFLVMAVAIGLFFAAAKYAEGVLANIFLIIAVLGVIKFVFFMTSKTSERIIDWWAERPLWMWRVWAACFVLIGWLLQRVRFT